MAMILDDLNDEEMSEEKLRAALRWFEEHWFKETPGPRCTVHQCKIHGRSLLELIKEARHGHDK